MSFYIILYTSAIVFPVISAGRQVTKSHPCIPHHFYSWLLSLNQLWLVVMAADLLLLWKPFFMLLFICSPKSKSIFMLICNQGYWGVLFYNVVHDLIKASRCFRCVFICLSHHIYYSLLWQLWFLHSINLSVSFKFDIL